MARITNKSIESAVKGLSSLVRDQERTENLYTGFIVSSLMYAKNNALGVSDLSEIWLSKGHKSPLDEKLLNVKLEQMLERGDISKVADADNKVMYQLSMAK